MIYQTELDLDIPSAPAWQKRDFHGFAQFREAPGEPWRFNVCGFDSTYSGTAGYCNVLCTDGTEACVSIDAGDRILINECRFGRLNWFH